MDDGVTLFSGVTTLDSEMGRETGEISTTIRATLVASRDMHTTFLCTRHAKQWQRGWQAANDLGDVLVP